MKKIYISMFALTALFFTGCADDYLDVDQTEAISTNDIELFNDNAGASSFVNSIYDKFLDWDTTSFGWIGITSIITDDADKGSSPGDTGGDQQILDNLSFNASTGTFNDNFNAYYAGINRCNQALNIIPKLDKADASLRTRLLGEAKFMRAFMYFTLVKFYGGVPIIDHLPVPASDADKIMQLTRKPASEVYAFIENDLKEAIQALPLKSAYAPDEKARVSKGSAYALLAKVNLYQKNWQKVIDNCDLVTGYTLVTDYSSMFKLEGENGPESIFEINGVGATPAKGIQQYSQVQGARGTGGWGWGFNTPSQSLVNAYEPGDLRKAATIMFRGQTLYDGKILPTTVENERYNYKAYSSNYTGADDSDANVIFLRYGEVVLMKAEALNELGQTNEAIPLLNQIRNRAGLANTTFTSQADIRTAIWKERRVELAMEFDRYFDLVRTGQAKAAFAIDGKVFTEGKNELFPIPQLFLNQTGGLSQQNPGYN